MNDEKVFVDGMIIKNKTEGTPDWVKEKIEGFKQDERIERDKKLEQIRKQEEETGKRIK